MNESKVFDRMRADHERVRRDMDALEAAAGRSPDAAVMQTVLEGLEREFEIHMDGEDAVLFPALLRALPHSLGHVEGLAAEHRDLRGMLSALLDLITRPAGAARDEQLGIQTRDFVDLLRIHLRKEEAVVFRVAEQFLGAGEVERLAAHLARAARSPHPGSIPTKGNHS